MERPETSKCSRLESRMNKNFNKSLTNFPQNYKDPAGKQNGINNLNNKQTNVEQFSSTTQGFFTRQNSQKFEKGITLDQYFGGNFKVISAHQQDLKCNKPTKNENNIYYRVSNSRSSQLNKSDVDYNQDASQFEINEEDEEQSEPNRNSRGNMDDFTPPISKKKSRGNAPKKLRNEIVENQIENNDFDSEDKRDSKITKKIREKYTKKV